MAGARATVIMPASVQSSVAYARRRLVQLPDGSAEKGARDRGGMVPLYLSPGIPAERLNYR
jgi:hypothetical protein